MARRFRKRRKFRRRHNVRSRSRRFRRVFRRFRRTSRTFGRNKKYLALNTKQVAPAFVFLKLKITKAVHITNSGSAQINDDVILGNSLDESTSYSTNWANLPYNLYQLAMWYRNYYVWKVDIKATFYPQGDNQAGDTTSWHNPLSMDPTANTYIRPYIVYAKPDTNAAAYLSTNWGWGNYKDNMFDSRRAQVKRFTNYSAIYKGPPTVRNSVRTKTIFEAPQQDNVHYQGTITPGASSNPSSPLVNCVSPANLYYWHVGVMSIEETGTPADTMYGLLWTQRTIYVKFMIQRDPTPMTLEN